MARGKLVVVGTGINTAEHITAAARDWIQRADKVFYLVAGHETEVIIKGLSPDAASLLTLYDPDIDRAITYKMIVELLVGSLQSHSLVCGVFYGHPGIFSNPGPEAVRWARQLGCDAILLPAISSEDCLFADLAVDPSARGCQSYEATDFLIRERVFDPTASLILWQIDAIGCATGECLEEGYQSPHLDVLAEVLMASYGADHRVVIYEAATTSKVAPRITSVPLTELPKTPLTTASTLYVPPLGRMKPNREMIKRLGL